MNEIQQDSENMLLGTRAYLSNISRNESPEDRVYRLTSIRDNLNNNESEERFVHRLNLEPLTNEIKKESAHHLNLSVL